MSYDIYTGVLKMNSEFENGGEDILEYDFNHPSLQIIKEKYNLVSVAGYGNDLSKAFNLLHWVCNHIMHSGNSQAKATNIIDFMEYSFDKDDKFGLNCAMLSHVLAGCIMAVGIYAREVKLIPCSPYDFDSHRVVQIYSADMKKWIMFDPTYSGYAMDKNNKYLDILEIRRLLSEQEDIFLNKEFNYNGQKWDENFYKEYLAKNTFCLCTPALMSFDSIKSDGFVYVCPVHFDIKRRDIYCLEYKIKKGGYDMGSYIETAKNDKYSYLAVKTLFKSPI
ncbi:MAG: hypothetical protein FWD71_11080 [Oscillospiraceae bacterium]|nr:hypothetical protein [Oscillospiraceae bacterium]